MVICIEYFFNIALNQEFDLIYKMTTLECSKMISMYYIPYKVMFKVKTHTNSKIEYVRRVSGY